MYVEFILLYDQMYGRVDSLKKTHIETGSSHLIERHTSVEGGGGLGFKKTLW